MIIVTTKRFNKEASRLLQTNPLYARRLDKTMVLLRRNIKHPSLRMHKLVGSTNYSVSVDMKIRILLHIDDEKIYVLRIGTHEEVY